MPPRRRWRDICDGHGGSSAARRGQDAAERDDRRVQNGLERGMKGGIIMARHRNAGRKTSTLHMLETDARLALIQDWLSRELRLPVASASSRPPAMPVSAVTSARFAAHEHLHRHGCAAGQGGRAPVPEGVAAARVPRRARAARARARRGARAAAARGPRRARSTCSACRRATIRSRCTAMPWTRSRVIQVRGAGGRARELAPYGRASCARELALMPEWFLAPPPGADAHRRRGSELHRRRVRVPDRAKHSRSRRCSCIATTTRATSW